MAANDDRHICGRCQSERLYSFEADRNARTSPGTLPVVCRDCGLITVNGLEVHFPPAFEEQAKSMAELAATAGQEATRDLKADQDPKIANYFARVYRNGYMDGFWRALLFWKHNAKEGRLIRLRDLWKRRGVWAADALNYLAGAPVNRVVLEMDETVYAEFS
ncbi:MAG: hypothetical protein EPN91_03905, partial [Salinibacterium sp.]